MNTVTFLTTFNSLYKIFCSMRFFVLETQRSFIQVNTKEVYILVSLRRLARKEKGR